MKYQAYFLRKINVVQEIKCLLQFLFGALRAKDWLDLHNNEHKKFKII